MVFIYYARMGVKMFDHDTKGHILGGMLACSLFQYSNIPVVYNFILTNGIHIIIELIEKNATPDGRILETKINHIGDSISFFVGWIIAYYFKFERFICPNNVIILWCILLGYTITEIVREVFPYQPLLSGTYTHNSK